MDVITNSSLQRLITFRQLQPIEKQLIDSVFLR